MNKLIALLGILVLAGVSSVSIAADRVGDFALLDQDGYFHKMSYYDDHKAIAFLVQGNSSKATASAIDQFEALQEQYSEVKFFMINSSGSESRADVKKALAKYKSDIPVLMDDAQLISEAMGVSRTGEVFLFSPTNFTVLYRGPVKSGLDAAIKNVLAGEEIKNPQIAMKGSDVSYPAQKKHEKGISYAEDVAPILADNCARCHREGGIAPFAMNSHAMIQGWAPMIREVLLTKRMPPGQIDPMVGHFKETYTLTPSETQTVVHWVEAGAKKDGKEDPLAQLTWPETKWAFGEPDLIIKVPEQKIPATGVLDYITVNVPIDIDKDRWVRASQYVAGDRTVLHHTLNNVVPPLKPGEKRQRGGFLGGGNPDAPSITAYIPGAEPYHEPPNTGGLLKKGSSINLQLHYTTTGKATTDASEIGVWFYPEDQVPTERMGGQCACIFINGWDPIPPFEPDHEMTKSVTLDRDAYLYSMLPHMHFRGKRMRFYAEFPDGRREQLINIANYNYNWQLSYQLEEPLFLPAGTKMVAVGAFDNSAQNKANPDPSRTVPWGQQSWDEMFFGSMNWKYANQNTSTDDSVASQ